MNPRNNKLARALALLALIGCGSGSVGSDPCASNEDCSALPLSKSDEEPESQGVRVDVQPVAELAIDWVKRLPGPATLVNGAYNRVLRADARGLVVLFTSDERRSLHAARLDNAGELSGPALEVPAPDGWNGGAETLVDIAELCDGVCAQDGSASVQVSWSTDSFRRDVSWVSQKLIFSDDLSTAPKRENIGQRGEPSDLLRDADGNLYAFHADPDHRVAKLDGDTRRELWTQGGFFEEQWFPPRSEVGLSGVPLNDGRVVVLSQPSEGSFSSGAATYNARVSWLDAATGERTRTGISLLPSGFLFNAGDHATYVSAGNGDIVALNVLDAGHFESVIFQRQDYTLLQPQAAALDPSGNVYVLTYNGARSAAKPTVCRAQVPTGGECYTLPDLADDQLRLDGLVALSSGELYIHSGFDLIHITFPQP